HKLPWRSAVVGRRARGLGRPFEQHTVVRVHSAWCRMEVRWRRHVRGVGVGVELPEALAALLAELRMKREALEAALTAHRLDRHVLGVDIQILSNRPAAL